MRLVSVIISATCLVLAGCGSVTSVAPGDSGPPHASVLIGTQQVQSVLNGYQWTSGNHSIIGDAASDPAANLTVYEAISGQEVRVGFDKSPSSVVLSMWSKGTKVKEQNLSQSSFSLPNSAGVYTYEITAHWGNNYVNYDFEVHVR